MIRFEVVDVLGKNCIFFKDSEDKSSVHGECFISDPFSEFQHLMKPLCHFLNWYQKRLEDSKAKIDETATEDYVDQVKAEIKANEAGG